MTLSAQLIEQFDAFTPDMQKIQRYKTKPFKWFYNTFVPRHIRKKTEQQAKLEQQQHLADCWDKLLAEYRQGRLPVFEIKPKQHFSHQKIIWQYWGQGIDDSLPDVVKLCFDSVDKYKGDFIVIRLDDSNLSEYLEFPDFVAHKRNNPAFRPVFFSDLLRLVLLYHYGGVWIDATILLTSKLDERFTSADFFAFERMPNTPNQEKWLAFNPDYFSWDARHKVNMLSSILFAKKHNPFVYDWLQLILFYWKHQNQITHYFFFQILFNQLKNVSTTRSVAAVDDTLPHLLISQLNEPFDEQDYQQILKQTHIHKLTYIKECRRGSYYEHIKQAIQGK